MKIGLGFRVGARPLGFLCAEVRLDIQSSRVLLNLYIGEIGFVYVCALVCFE